MSSINYHAFTSDNSAGICPEALAAIVRANEGSAPSYGADRWTREACDRLRALFEKPDAEIFFVFNGTAANSLALASLCQSYHSVICHDYAHVETDECGAPEFFSNGTKLLSTGGAAGKLAPESVERLITRRSDIHYPKARVLSLSQSTEWGSVYSLDELKALTAVARRHGLAVHMDGARFSNAAASTNLAGLSPADITWRAGIDVLCFGGTKNGMTTTEAVIFFNPSLAQDFDYRCKQSGQLGSKMRFLSCQWLGLLENGAWLRHAAHANASARRLAEGFRALGLSLVLDPAANAVFVELSPAMATALRAKGWSFYNFVGAPGYRFMTSWATREDDINALLADVRAALSS
jgi:threonine aldolase